MYKLNLCNFYNRFKSVFIRQHINFDGFTAFTSWTILSPIEKRIKEKIEAIGTPLKDWDVTINYGIKTGLNEAFIIDGNKRKEMIAADPKSEEIIRPILRGRDIQKWSVNYEDLWVILAKFNSYKYLQQDYPIIFNHLKSYESLLKNRGQCRYLRGNINSKNNDYLGQHHWLELDNNPSLEYLALYNIPKIIYPEITKFLNFYYDDNIHYYANNKCFILTGKHLEYLGAFLNSSLFKFCYRNNFPELLGGSRELRKVFFEKLKVLSISDDQNEIFKEKILVINSLNEQNADSSYVEKELDDLIFDLYSLTDKEKKLIGFIQIK